MPPKQRRAVKISRASDANRPAADNSSPSLDRSPANSYLYNQDLFGLNPKPDFRTRLIIGCYVFDNIQPSVIRAAFAKAHIYPPSAVKELKRGVSCRNGGMAARESSRLLKDKAARELEILGQRASLMSSGDVICKAHEIVSNVLNADQYAMRPLEELVPSSRKKKDHVKDAGPIHKKVVGLFTPADSQAVADSFSEMDRVYNATHLFVCPEDGCSRRFASCAWLAAHLKSVHHVTIGALSPAEEAHRKALMQQQKQARSAIRVADDESLIDADDDHSESLVALDDGPYWECQHPPDCHVQGVSLAELYQHYAQTHPKFIKDGFSVLNLKTGVEGRPDSSHVPLDDDTAGFIKLAMFDIDDCNAENLEYQLNWLRYYEEKYGTSDPAEAHAEYEIGQHSHEFEKQNHTSVRSLHPSPSPSREKKRQVKRKCSKCNCDGHQRNSKRCPFNRVDVESLCDEEHKKASLNIVPTPPTTPSSPL